MASLSDGANLAITIFFILGIGYLIYRIDRRVRREGPLVPGDGSEKSRRDDMHWRLGRYSLYLPF
ncbi:MAG: hypothetical protein JXA42_26920 [Anaerolineales bacterium]|nr:hypothetical protein [Anaerolineales bacterium]